MGTIYIKSITHKNKKMANSWYSSSKIFWNWFLGNVLGSRCFYQQLSYPKNFYVDKYNIPSGELKTSKTYSPGNYVAILYGSDDSSAFHILDYSTFVLSGSGCQPPNGLHRKCIDDETIAVWNVKTCSYDQAPCSTGACKDGNCIPSSGLPPFNNTIWIIAVALVGIYLLMKGGKW